MVNRQKNSICGVMVSTLSSNGVDHGFEPDQIKPKTKIGICCFSTKPAGLRGKTKDWSTWNQDDVSKFIKF
jgi:hypothetical protein